MKNIQISIGEYIQLKQDQRTLELLEVGGVDNWEWYGDSLNPDGEDFDDIMDKIKSFYEEENNW